jgi:hypothetical protein
VRRIPCLCDRCYRQLKLPLLFNKVPTDGGPKVDAKHPSLQPRFNHVVGCTYEPVMNDLNDWNFVELDENAKFDQGEVNVIFQDALTGMESAVENDAVSRGFGAVSGKYHALWAQDSIYLVQWQGEVFPLQVPTVLENCGPVPMPIGTMVARGFYWQRVIGKGSEYWYERPKNYTDVKVFWTRHVLKGKVEAAKPSTETGDPPVLKHLQFYNQDNRSLCRKVDDMEWKELFFEKHVREKLQIVDIETEDEVQEVKVIREEAAKEKAKSDEKERKRLKLLSLCHLPVCLLPEVPTAEEKAKPKAKGKAKGKAKAKAKNKSKEKTLPKEKPPPKKKAPAKKSKKRTAAQTPRLGFAI